MKLYTNKSLLIIGGESFLGKVLVEKILRTIPNINKIYIFQNNFNTNSFE